MIQAWRFEVEEEEEVVWSKFVLQDWQFEAVEEELFSSKLGLHEPALFLSPPPKFYCLGGDNTRFFLLEGGVKLQLFDFFSWYVVLERWVHFSLEKRVPHLFALL